jgi:hypothetical protein
MGGFMSAQDRQPDPAPVAGTQVKLTGTAESAARRHVPPETDKSTLRAGEQPEPKGPTARTKSPRAGPLPGIRRGLGVFFQSIKRGLGVFAAGFRGVTWEHKADEVIKAGLGVFDEMHSLSDVDKQRLKPRIEELLQTQRYFLRSGAAVEAIAKRLTWLLCICAVVVPAVVVGLTTSRGWGAVGTYFAYLFGFALLVTWPTVLLEKLTGRYRAGVIWMALVLWAYIASAAWIVTAHGSSDPNDAILVAVVCAATALTILLVARAYIVAWNKNALINAWAEQRLEAAVVWTLLRVVLAVVEEPGKDGTPTPLQRSGEARALLAGAAEAVNDYLPRLIDGGRVNAQSIASEGAAALLDLRSAVNLPGGRVREEDLARLTATIEAWSIGSLADMPRKLRPAADSLEPSSRRSGLLQVVRKLLLGALPLILLIVVTLLPLKMPAAVTAALAPFAVTWLLLSLASVFAPADVKMDTKTLFGR